MYTNTKELETIHNFTQTEYYLQMMVTLNLMVHPCYYSGDPPMLHLFVEVSGT